MAVNPAKFVREARQEIAKVTWPTRKETTISVTMVLALVVVAAVFFLAVDNIILFLVELVLGLGS